MGDYIVAEGLRKTFRMGATTLDILKGVDLSLKKGEVLSIVGASGVGKSTLLHLLGALDRPTEGKVYYGDDDVFQMDDNRLASFRNRRIGFVFQFHHLLPEFDVLENTLMPSLIRGEDRDKATERALAILESVGLKDRLTHRPGEISGGEQQRTAIARALMGEPDVILADEPTGNLDTHTAAHVHELILRLNQTHQTTFVLVTHNEKLAGMAHRTARMVDGRIEEIISR
ncbi:MAG: ABC transporter ATP-binding protein [Nitrospirota bacterium]|nr:ABC transporter ATP-binding protein [Nitrospirota bacterium]